MSQEIALIEEITEEKAPAIYGHKKVKSFYERVKEEVCAEVPDVSTQKGRDRIASLSGKVSSAKKAVENPGRAYLKHLKEIPKVIEAELREFVIDMDKLRDDVRQPLTDYENAEKTRKAAHQIAIANINLRIECRDLDSEELKTNISLIESIKIDEKWEEFEEEAARAKDSALSALRDALIVREKYEAEQAELARLRQEAAEREQKDREELIAREAAENARKQAEQAAEAERKRIQDEADRKARDQQLEIERAQREKAEQEAATLRQQQEHAQALAKAEQDRKDAIAQAERDKQAAIEAEQRRQQQEAERLRFEEEQRAKNKAHAKKINNEILEDIVAVGCNEDCAKLVIAAIARGQVRHTQIKY